MSKIIEKLRGRPSAPLPLDLSELSARQKQKALEHRRERMVELAREGKGASRARREEILAELTLDSRDVRRLQQAGVSTDYVAGGESAEEAAIRAKWERAPTLEDRKDTPTEKAVSALVSNWVPPPELHGLKLYAEKITDEEGEELWDLLDRRYGAAAGTGWKDEHRGRFEALVEKLAGRDCFAELRFRAERDEIMEEVRREALPKRREFAEIGSVALPAELFDVLRASTGSSLTIADVGTLAVLQNAFELRDASLLQNARFEDDVLIVKGRKLRFVGNVNPSADPLGPNRVQPDLVYLARTGWLDVTRRQGGGGRTEIRLGSKAKALREGKP